MRLGMWMTSYPEAMGWGFWVIFEKEQLVEIWNWAKRVDFWASAKPDQLGLRDAPRVAGSDGTISIVKIVCLSLLVSKNLKVKKVIKVSYHELPRVVSVSSVFPIPMHMNVLHICRFYVSVYFVYSYYGYVTWGKAWTHLSIYTQTNIHLDTRTHIHMHTHIHKWTYAHIYTRTHIHSYTQMNIHLSKRALIHT